LAVNRFRHQVRHAGTEDAAFVMLMARHAATLEDRPLPAAYAEDVIELLPSGEDVVLVIEQDRSPLGAAWWTTRGESLLEGFQGVPEVSMAIAPEVRGQGLGTELLQALVAEGDKQRRPLVLNVHLRNTAALNLYMSCGFRVAGAGRGWFGVAMARQFRRE